MRNNFDQKSSFILMAKTSAYEIGFSWAGQKNMSYKFGNASEVDKNVNSFRSHFSYLCAKPLISIDPIHENKITNLDSSDFGKEVSEGVIHTDCIFTKRSDLAFCIKPADCIGAVVTFTHMAIPYIGLVHIGRVDFENDFPSKMRDYIKENYNPIYDLKLYLTPAIQRYIFKADDKIPDFWSKKIQKMGEKTYVDFSSSVYDEFCSLFREENVYFYDADTWCAARDGISFSHAYSFYHPTTKEGRFILCGCLK